MHLHFLPKFGNYLNNLLIIDQETMKPSHSKVFAWVGFIALTYAFLVMFQKDDSLFLVYGGLIFGNHIGTRIVNKKQTATGDNSTDLSIGNSDNTPK